MIIGRSSVFYADRKSKMAATTGHSINTGPYGENTEIYSSLKLLHWLNLNCASIIGRSFTNFVFFYVDRNSKMTTTAWHSFYIGPIGSFYNQVNDTGSWEPLVEICFHSAGHRSSTQKFSAGHSEFLPNLHFLCQIVLMPSNVIPLLLF
jgi:hypothetical protein